MPYKVRINAVKTQKKGKKNQKMAKFGKGLVNFDAKKK